MGSRIESVATASERGHLVGRGALHLIDAAAKLCLRRAHHSADELDILINAGLYKDLNAAEPALASIIQEDIGANPELTPLHGHGTFSFDVLNGGCGVITGMQIVDSFVGHGNARHGMVVAGDADPSHRTSHHFPFAPAGGAILLDHTDDDTGFRDFELRTFPEYASLFRVQLRWEPDAGMLHRGRNVVDVHEEPEFAGRCIALAVDVASQVLDRSGLHADDIGLLIGSQYPRTFAASVADRLGLPSPRVPAVSEPLAASHTAGPIAAMEAAIASGQLASTRHTLFVTAGAGITIGVALYEHTAPAHS
jgi:3-oxoacyl-[acyl-carrier-protein] synthase-3